MKEEAMSSLDIQDSTPDAEYTYMTVKCTDMSGNLQNEKFFIGALPLVGESVEMVYVGDFPDGSMRFQLKVKDETV